MKKAMIFAIAVGVTVASLVSGSGPAYARGHGNPLDQVVVYVSGQDLYYDTQIPTELPFEGRFQKLEMGGPHGGPMTEYGPGDPGYLGGRWWVDLNGNGVQDEDDFFFLCPLLGPGRDTE